MSPMTGMTGVLLFQPQPGDRRGLNEAVEFHMRGEIERALVNIGREEIAIEGLKLDDSRLRILGASSSYLVVDTSAAPGAYRVGDELTFALNYGALLTAMTSEDVTKNTLRGAPAAQVSEEAKVGHGQR